MKPQPQLALPFVPDAADDRADFLEADTNREALRWIERWPDWPACGLVLCGPAGAGKSHLARIWARRAVSSWLDGAILAEENPAGLADRNRCWVIDRAKQAPERPLLHFYNLMVERRGSLLLTAIEPPPLWSTVLPDLRSRLASLPVATIGQPDEALVQGLLIKLFADRQLSVGADVLAFLSMRLERSYDAIAQLAAALDAASLSRQQPITIPLAAEVLKTYLDRRT